MKTHSPLLFGAVSIALYCHQANSQNIISTVVGGGVPATLTTATLSTGFTSIAMDNAKNLYLADAERVYRITPSGECAIVAGTGGPPQTSEIYNVSAIAVDSASNLFVYSGLVNSNLARIDGVTGAVTVLKTFNGGSTHAPNALVFAPNGELYVLTSSSEVVTKIALDTGIETTVAGGVIPPLGSFGNTGDGGPATRAVLNLPMGIALLPSGDLLISTIGAIRKVSHDTGIINTVANITAQSLATSVAGQLYFSAQLQPSFQPGVYSLDLQTGRATIVAGGGNSIGDGGAPTAARFGAKGLRLAFASDGALLVADPQNTRVRRVDLSRNVISTLIGGGGVSGNGGPANNAPIGQPTAVTVDTAGNLYFSDNETLTVRKVDGKTGVIGTVAGNGSVPTGSVTTGGSATQAAIQAKAIAVDSQFNLYLGGGLQVTPSGLLARVTPPGSLTFGDQVTVDASGTNVYFEAESGPPNNGAQVWRLNTQSGVFSHIAGNGKFGSPVPGPALNSPLYSIMSLAAGTNGDLYIGDYLTIWKVSGATNNLSKVDDAPLGASYLAVDSASNVYFTQNSPITPVRKVSAADGSDMPVTSTAIPGDIPYSGEGGPAGGAMLGWPTGLAFDKSGNLYVGDVFSARVLQISGIGAGATGVPLAITTSSLQPATARGRYTQSLRATGGTPPYTWSLASGTFPAGITLATDGTISGTPTVPGVSTFVISVADSALGTASGSFTLNVACGYAINPGGQAFPAAGGSGSIVVTTDPGCAWTATTNAPWLTLGSDASGSGNGSTTYVVSANAGAAISDIISIAGLSFRVEQAGASITGFSNAGSIAHLAVSNDGWSTTFSFLNPSSLPTSMRLSFIGDDGNPLPLSVSFPQTGVSNVLAAVIDRTLNPGALLEIVAANTAGQPSAGGWAQVLSSGSLVGFASLRLVTGNLDVQAVAPLETRSANTYFLPYDANGFQMTVAFTNTSAVGGEVDVTTRNDEGTTLLSSSFNLPAMGHVTLALPYDFFAALNSRGSLQVDAAQGMQLSVLGMQFNTATGSFSIIPALAR